MTQDANAAPLSAARGRESAEDLALVAVFAALVAVLSLASVTIAGGVPITLQTLAVALTAMVLGPWRAFAVTLLYMAVGFVGLPVFAGGGAGVGVLAGPSAGYLLSFPLFAVLVGWLAQRMMRQGWRPVVLWLFVVGMIGNILIVYPLGIVGLHLNAGLSWSAAFVTNLAFVLGDLIKTGVAALIAWTVLKAFPALALGRQRSA